MNAPVAASRNLHIDNDIMAVLARATMQGDALTLPPDLDRACYLRVDKVLAAAGGRWHKHRRAHVFRDGDAAAAIEPMLIAGTLSLAPDLGWFPTPPSLAADLVRRSGARPYSLLLEPSAGEGAIVKAAIAVGATVEAMEIDPARVARLVGLAGDPPRFRVLKGDFLERVSEPLFDTVVMNPPFAPKTMDLHHVRHAFGFLRPGGRLVAVMSAGTMDRVDRKTSDFRDLVHGLGGTIDPLPEDSFAASGTRVWTVVVTVDKPRDAAGRGSC